MKNTAQKLPLNLAILAFVCSATLTPAAEIRKANSGDPLESGLSWLGGIAPSTNDVAVWDSAAGFSSWFAVQTNTAWGGIAIRDVTDVPSPLQFTVQGTGPNPSSILSLGAEGIDLSEANVDVTLATWPDGQLELA